MCLRLVYRPKPCISTCRVLLDDIIQTDSVQIRRKDTTQSIKHCVYVRLRVEHVKRQANGVDPICIAIWKVWIVVWLRLDDYSLQFELVSNVER